MFLSIKAGPAAGLQIAVGVGWPNQFGPVKYRGQWHGQNVWPEWKDV